MKKKTFYGKAIYNPNGKAKEYSEWACNLYTGCTNGCAYCYNNLGILAKRLGGNHVNLKKSLVDEETAFIIFKKELEQCRENILDAGLLHFNFVSDPCLPQTIKLNWQCIDYAISQGIPCQVLTKRADWLSHPAVQNALTEGRKYLKIGFSLTGHDELEPFASANEERTAAMKQLHDSGVVTWASIEPIIDPQSSYEVISATRNYCDHYKIGILSGRKNYTPDDIKLFVEKVCALNLPSVYWKKSLIDFIM